PRPDPAAGPFQPAGQPDHRSPRAGGTARGDGPERHRAGTATPLTRGPRTSAGLTGGPASTPRWRYPRPGDLASRRPPRLMPLSRRWQRLVCRLGCGPALADGREVPDRLEVRR